MKTDMGINQKASPIERFNAAYLPVTESGCWLWERALNKCGYGLFSLNGKPYLAHRAGWILHEGPIPEGMCALHKCDTPSCVNPSHLYLGTQAENAIDRESRNRVKNRKGFVAGDAHPNSKLTCEKVAEMRELKRCGVKQRVIARQFGVSEGTVSYVMSGVVWSHVA